MLFRKHINNQACTASSEHDCHTQTVQLPSLGNDLRMRLCVRASEIESTCPARRTNSPVSEQYYCIALRFSCCVAAVGALARVILW